MQQTNDAWVAMFRRLPGSLHETLALTLRTGTEIVVQRIMKLEPEFAIIRGRVSGTQDAGRIVMIPYTEMTFASLTKLLKDPEVEAIFGKGAPPALADLPTLGAISDPATAAAPRESAEEEPDEAPAAKKPEGLSKTQLVAKLRERLKEAK